MSSLHEQKVHILNHVAPWDFWLLWILKQRLEGRKFHGSKTFQKPWLQSSWHCLHPSKCTTVHLKCGWEGSNCSKGRRLLWGDVKVLGWYNCSFVFYSPAVIRNGMPLLAVLCSSCLIAYFTCLSAVQFMLKVLLHGWCGFQLCSCLTTHLIGIFLWCLFVQFVWTLCTANAGFICAVHFELHMF